MHMASGGFREVRRLYAPSSFTANAGLRSFSTDSALPSFPQIRFSRGHFSELHYGLLALQPADLFALLTDRTDLHRAMEDYCSRAQTARSQAREADCHGAVASRKSAQQVPRLRSG